MQWEVIGYGEMQWRDLLYLTQKYIKNPNGSSDR